AGARARRAARLCAIGSRPPWLQRDVQSARSRHDVAKRHAVNCLPGCIVLPGCAASGRVVGSQGVAWRVGGAIRIDRVFRGARAADAAGPRSDAGQIEEAGIRVRYRWLRASVPCAAGGGGRRAGRFLDLHQPRAPPAMIFLTYWFVCFAVGFLALYVLVRHPAVRLALLLVACGAFYWHFAGPSGVVPIAFLAVVTYL